MDPEYVESEEDLDVDDERDDDVDGDNDDDERDESREKVSRSAARALRRERANNRKLTAEVAELRKAIKNGGIGTEPDKNKVDVEAIRKQIMEEVTQKVTADANARILVTEAKSLLKEAGFGGSAARGVRLLDLDGIPVTDGRVDEDELLDRIEELKEESPGLFERRARSSRDTDRSRSNGRRRRDDEDDDARDSSTRRTRTEGMSRERNGGTQRMDSLERALRDAVGAPRNRE